MTLQEKLNEISAFENYVMHSLFCKSYDNDGSVWKWLENKGDGTADRKELFVWFADGQEVVQLLQKEIGGSIKVNNPI
jgi:hypothetical protein